MNIFQDELNRVAKDEKKLEKLASRTSAELAKVRARKEALLKLIEPEATTTADNFEDLFNSFKDQLPDIDDDQITDDLKLKDNQKTPAAKNGHRSSRVPAETKTFALLHAISKIGEGPYTVQETSRIAKDAGLEHDERIIYSLLNKQLKTGRIRRAGLKYRLTQKGFSWVRQVLGIDEPETAESQQSLI